ncbi:hypothetical protein TRFO_41899 [Tritrichomonas foetus]|uniref:Uncharacterized protein n=1 Tax=Tritrichomonas foetus TaxID=1144522 RepID=A0A1J4L2Q5_9EUKA|nr:hypothetical protein TRFO_41899 [Tritrichomonas foetus]|eukprot:OHT16252.1 hypothetical protein TRFO_41899 [Tritrichomonas foetus]
MAAKISEPYSFLPESQISSDIFSSNPSVFPHLEFDDGKRNNYNFYRRIKTEQLDSDIQHTLAPHRQTSIYTWATSIQLSEQETVYGIFSPSGVNIWKPGNDGYSRFIEIQPVPIQKACFVDCISSLALIFTYGEKEIYVISDVLSTDLNCIELPDKVRTIGKLTQETALIITESSQAILLDVPTNTFSVKQDNKFKRYIPFRDRAISDSVLFTSNDQFIFSASYSHFSIFRDDFSLLKSISTPVGKPILFSIYESTVFLLIFNENSSKHQIFEIINIFDDEPIVKTLNFEPTEDVVSIIAIENDICLILTKWHAFIMVISDITSQSSVTLSKSFDDFLLTGCLISDHSVSILAAKEGLHILEILSYDELQALIPFQVNRISAALQIHSNPNSDINYAISILQKYYVSVDAFIALDQNRISALSQYENIDINLKIHIDLVELFNKYSNAVVPQFEINAYNLIILKSAVDFVAGLESCEYDVLHTAINRKDVESILVALNSDIATLRFELIDLLITIIQQCIDHYMQYKDIYRSQLKCNQQIIDMLDLALQNFTNVYNPSEHKVDNKSGNLSDHNHIENCNFTLDDYCNLLVLSFKIFPDIEKSLKYAFVLYDINIDKLEKIAVDEKIYPILAGIIHKTGEFDRCDCYYDYLGILCIKPILNYLSEKQYTSDLLQIGEHPVWREHVSNILNYDDLARGFHFISEDGENLDKTATLLWNSAKQGIAENQLTLDQAATLCSIALICCIVNDNLKNLKDEITQKIMLLELQKTSGVDAENIWSSEKLINHFVDQLDFITALSVFGCSMNEREEQINNEILVKILNEYTKANEVISTDILVPILQETRAAKDFPDDVFSMLDDIIKDTTKVKLIKDSLTIARRNIHEILNK